ncbi:shikimate dehydrogenase [Fluviibacterium sp. S390]|uniref:shikimate dehydrogenase n=1 Tax=Fluviibacterium sp. S390 TaxID=3415139 RepID=UPI003C7DC120
MSADPIPLAGVIGWPIGHSKSPRVHGYWLNFLGISGHYVPMGVAPEDLETVLRTLPKAGFVGCNVTLPHKEAALALADEVSDRAARVGAANTLVFKDGKIHADNTDGYGFIANLKQNAPDWRPEAGPAAVFGAGGAARGVIDGLLTAGVPEIRLTNRTRARAEVLAQHFGDKVTVIHWERAETAAAGANTLVNTTSLGMEGQPPFTLSLAGAAKGALATDIVYVPLDTPFLKEARKHGLQTVDGLGMLLHQAVPGFNAWFGTNPLVDDALRDVVLAP